MRFLWDGSLLIARVYPGHPHVAFAKAFTARNPDFAICPIAEGSLVRHCLRSAPEGVKTAESILSSLQTLAGYEFWPDDLSYREVGLSRIQGHKQVTDAYLVALAAHHGGRLATFDRALAAVHPEAVLVPTG